MSAIAIVLFAVALPNAVVLQPVMNLYSRPALDADVVSQAIYAANVMVLEEKDGWAKIRTADDYSGLGAADGATAGSAVRREGPGRGGAEPVRAYLPRGERHEARAGHHGPL